MIYVKYVYNICRIYDTLLTNKAEVAEEKNLYIIFLVESPFLSPHLKWIQSHDVRVFSVIPPPQKNGWVSIDVSPSTKKLQCSTCGPSFFWGREQNISERKNNKIQKRLGYVGNLQNKKQGT